MQTRARTVLVEALALLEEVERIGLMEAIAKAKFADVKRAIDGGKGLDGVLPKGDSYANPLLDRMKQNKGAARIVTGG